jgi:hypothetical protein
MMPDRDFEQWVVRVLLAAVLVKCLGPDAVTLLGV